VSDPINSSSSLDFGDRPNDSSTGSINNQCTTTVSDSSIKESNTPTLNNDSSNVVTVDDDSPEEESGAELLPAFRKQYEKASEV
jgi:hypothetical protein